MFSQLPWELQLSIARRLDSRSRLALGATCQDCIPLAVHVAVLAFKVGKKIEVFHRCIEDGQWVSLEKVAYGSSGAAKAFAGSRKKGHSMPLYDALASADESDRLMGECHGLSEADGFRFPWPPFTNCGAARSLVSTQSQQQTLSVGLDPSFGAIGLSSAVLTTLNGGWPPSTVGSPNMSLKTSLVVLDLSRAHHLASIAAAGLACLQKARLPAAARVVCFDGCGQLRCVHPTDGCAALQSLRMDGCRKLDGASFRQHTWQLSRLEELDLVREPDSNSALLALLEPDSTRGLSLGLTLRLQS